MDSSPLVEPQTSPSSIVEIRSIPPPVSYNRIDVNGCKQSGMIQSIIGTLSIIFGAVCMGIECDQSSIAWPIWGGVWLIVYALLNVFSGIIAFNMLVAMSQAAMEESENSEVSTSETARIALDCVLVFLSAAEICAAVWGGIISIRALTKINKQRSMLSSGRTTSTYQTIGSTAVITSSFQPPPCGTAGYPPHPGFDAPPKYEDVPTSEMPPRYDDTSTTTDQTQQQSN